jgi:hypothetical protein
LLNLQLIATSALSVTLLADKQVRAMEYRIFTVMKKPFNSDDIMNIVRSFVQGAVVAEYQRGKHKDVKGGE